MYACMYFMRIYVCACIYVYMHICMHVCIHVCIYVIFKLGFKRYRGGIVLDGRGFVRGDVSWVWELSREGNVGSRGNGVPVRDTNFGNLILHLLGSSSVKMRCIT